MKIIVNLLILFLFTMNGIQSEDQENEDSQFLKLVADKICVANPEKNFAEKITNCENFMKPTVFQLNS